MPQGWDDHAQWTVELGTQANPPGYANVLAEEESAGDLVTNYVVSIFPSMLDRLSDVACRWIFAHELAHVASKLRQGSILVNGKPYTKLAGETYVEAPKLSKTAHEDAADSIALEWGFDRERQAFLTED